MDVNVKQRVAHERILRNDGKQGQHNGPVCMALSNQVARVYIIKQSCGRS